MAGYSGTPITKKLGLKPGMNVQFINAPDHYRELINDVLQELTEASGTTYMPLDFVHLFCTTKVDLEQAVSIKPKLKKDGMLWISWPKGTSQISSEINREDVREFVLAIGLVDVKVAAVDEDWSGLKFVYRTKDR